MQAEVTFEHISSCCRKDAQQDRRYAYDNSSFTFVYCSAHIKCIVWVVKFILHLSCSSREILA
jgi:hypothetical protein